MTTRQFSETPDPIRQSSAPVSPASPTKHRHHIPTPSSTAISTPTSPSQTPALGFLGSTSFSAVFTEQKANLDIGLAARSTMIYPTAQVRLNQDQDLVRAGARLLSMFRYIDLIGRFVEHWYWYAHGLPVLAPVVRAALASTNQLYSSTFKEAGNENQLLALAEKIFQNTARPLRASPYTSAPAYASMFIGENLRWEILGIIITLVGASATTLSGSSHPLWDDVEAERLDKKQFVREIVELSNVSLSLVRSDGEPNDLLAWLLYDNFMLSTVYHGDSSESLLLATLVCWKDTDST